MATSYIFHIGLHKTGTTAIQRYCANHVHDLAQQGVDFPVLAKHEMGPKRHRFLADWFRGRSTLVPADIASALNAGLSKAPSCLVSAEGLYLIRGRARIRALSAAFGPCPSAICYLREPVSHMLSLYKQQLKKEQNLGFSAFVETQRRELTNASAFGYYAFDRNLRKWSEAFDLRVKSYDSRNCLRDFCACIGLAPPVNGADEPDRMNVSFGEDVAALHFALNRGLQGGIVSPADWRNMKRLLKEALPASLPAAIAPLMPVATVEMQPFLRDFRAANPAYAWVADASPHRMTCFDSEKLDAGRIIDAIRAFLPLAGPADDRPHPNTA